MGYVHFTDEQKERANSVDLAEFLRRQGETLIPSGRDKRLASDHSVTIRGCEWYDHAAEQGGRAVSFVRRFYGLDYPGAVNLLLNGEQGAAYTPAPQAEPEQKPFILPQKNGNLRRVYAYLIKERGIDREVLTAFVRAGLIYEDAQHHNAVFVGNDTHGVSRHAHRRSTATLGKAFRMNIEGSDPRYSFHWLGTSERLYVFEAPIDLLSFISLYPEDWQEHSYVALCGTGGQAMRWMLEQLPQVAEVALCLDSDEPGQKATQRLAGEVIDKGLTPTLLLPELKDWNDVLTAQDDMNMKME